MEMALERLDKIIASTGRWSRREVKNLIRQLERENPGVKSRLFRAVIEGNIKGWPQL